MVQAICQYLRAKALYRSGRKVAPVPDRDEAGNSILVSQDDSGRRP